MHFHRRLGYLHFDTIIRMAKDPASGIKRTDVDRTNCLSCAQGKKSKNQQSRKDTGSNSPIDVIGGVIFSDLKGPITPKVRLGNRYMVNFIDHRTNYCRVFLAKTKDVAAQKFKHFMIFSNDSSTVEFTSSEQTEAESIRRWICFARSSALRGTSANQEIKPATGKPTECTAQ